MTIRVHRRVGISAAIAITSIAALSIGQPASAQTIARTYNVSKPATASRQMPAVKVQRQADRSLYLTSRLRDAHVHLMPTTAWLKAHSNFTSVQAAYGQSRQAPAVTATSGGLPAPACTLVSVNRKTGVYASPPGVGREGPLKSLAITAAGFATVGGNLQAEIKVLSLNSSGGEPDMPTGQPDNWFAQWTYGGNIYYLRAQYAGGDATTTTVYTYGTVKTEAVETLHVPSGSANGSMNLKTGIVTLTIPLSSVGSPKKGSLLSAALFETDVQVGSPLYTADLENARSDYKTGESGSSCPKSLTPPKPLPGAISTKGAQNNLTHYGGPVVHHITNYLIFWLPNMSNDGKHPAPSANGNPSANDSSVSCLEPATKTYNYEPATPVSPGTDASYEMILEQYFKDLPGTSFYNLLTQYADQTNGPVSNDPAFGGVYFDTCGYSSTPASGTSVPGGTAADPLYDVDIQNEVSAAMKVNGWTHGMDKQYFVYTGYDAASCFGPPSPGSPEPTCDVQGLPPAYCAYHGDFIDSTGTPVLYANMADGYWAGTQQAGLCYQTPIGATAGIPHKINNTTYTDWAADAEVAITSHEEFETATDPMVGTAANYGPGLGWYASPNDQGSGEIGDKCAYIYGNYKSDGSNIVLANGDHYIVQLEYSNWANGCSVGDNAVAPGAYGGAAPAVTLIKGWNLINIPTNGVASAAQLDEDIERAYQLSKHGSAQEKLVREVSTFANGRYLISIPGVKDDQSLSPGQGVFVYLTKGPFTWTPPGSVSTAGAPINLAPGWNLIGASWPNPGVMTDSLYNQIESENNLCMVNATAKSPAIPYDNPVCSPSLSDIATYVPTFDSKGNQAGGTYLDWKAVAPYNAAKDKGVWVQAQNQGGVFQSGNQVPFTSGMWIHTQVPVTWTPQGTECQTINNGMCQ